jgi:adenine-specific DNA methylase
MVEAPDETPSDLLAPAQEVLRHLDSEPSLRRQALLTETFGGTYFSFAQAAAIDALRSSITVLDARDQPRALAALLSVTSHCVNTVGKQFAQPPRLRKKSGNITSILVERALRDRALDVFQHYGDWSDRWRVACTPPRLEGRAVCADFRTFLGDPDTRASAIYADPPYTIDHYSRFYHVLETLVRYDSPTLGRMNKGGKARIMRGLYRDDRHQSPFCVPSKAEAAFEALFSGAVTCNAPLVLSYSPDTSADGNRPRLMAKGGILEIANRHYGRVKEVAVGVHSHRKLNAEVNNVPLNHAAEMLLVCTDPKRN